MLYFTLFVNCQFNYVNIVILSTIEHQLKTPLVGCLREKYFRKSFQGQKLRELFGNTKTTHVEIYNIRDIYFQIAVELIS